MITTDLLAKTVTEEIEDRAEKCKKEAEEEEAKWMKAIRDAFKVKYAAKLRGADYEGELVEDFLYDVKNHKYGYIATGCYKDVVKEQVLEMAKQIKED